ncbi:MAG: hypothetical protein E6J55_20655 [Deltaproteobacteria bacterium]|nr:MAG: hypothetical protein E6J55_20655 [Deltaproteobacteria bacterium]
MASLRRPLPLLVAFLGGLSWGPVTLCRAGGTSSTTETYAWGSAVPIPTGGPSWYDDAYYDQVLANGVAGTPLPAGAQMPDNGTYAAAGSASTGEAAPGVERPPIGIGPGTWLISLFFGKNGVPNGFAWCTANFVFQNGTSFGLGTAGHCASALSNPVTAFVVPPPEAPCPSGGVCGPGIYPIGKFSIVRNGGLGNDFALIAVNSAFNPWMRPTMPVFGGPTGAYTGGLPTVPAASNSVGLLTVLTPSYSPAVVGYCGHGAVVGTGGTCRAAAGLFASGTAFLWYGPSTPGDSGSGVVMVPDPLTPLAPVPATADLTHIIILDASVSRKLAVTIGPDYPGMVGGTQMARILSIVGPSWTLVNGGLP